jgi:hypothetical protein
MAIPASYSPPTSSVCASSRQDVIVARRSLRSSEILVGLFNPANGRARSGCDHQGLPRSIKAHAELRPDPRTKSLISLSFLPARSMRILTGRSACRSVAFWSGQRCDLHRCIAYMLSTACWLSECRSRMRALLRARQNLALQMGGCASWPSLSIQSAASPSGSCRRADLESDIFFWGLSKATHADADGDTALNQYSKVGFGCHISTPAPTRQKRWGTKTPIIYNYRACQNGLNSKSIGTKRGLRLVLVRTGTWITSLSTDVAAPARGRSLVRKFSVAA